MTSSGLLRIDPTRTAMLRAQFIRGLRRVFAELKLDLIELIVKEDAFGLKPAPVTFNRKWAYASQDEAVENFDKWLKDRINRGVSSPAEAERWRRYVGKGFEKGVNRAFADTKQFRKKGQTFILGEQPGFQESDREEFTRTALSRSIASEKLRLLRLRSLQEVEGMSGDMRNKARRVLTDGLVRGLSPREIAAKLSKVVDSSLARATTIARTELVRAHAEGQLSAMEQLGVDNVGVAVEWSAKGGACPLCVPMKGAVLKISEARGMIPRHPNCYCAWVPANLGEDKKGQKRTQKSIKSAIKDSKKEEGETDWGPNRPIAKKRPESPISNQEGCTCHPSLLIFARLLEKLERPDGKT